MKRLVIDLDGTLTLDADDGGVGYDQKRPNALMIEKVREYKAAGFEIIVATSRNMRTFSNSVGKINAVTLPIIIAWLERHEVPFDEIHVGKPWCGHDGFYVDDKAIRPSEFCDLSYETIQQLLNGEATNSL
jgi:capsule biosynthesis phosphatase